MTHLIDVQVVANPYTDEDDVTTNATIDFAKVTCVRESLDHEPGNTVVSFGSSEQYLTQMRDAILQEWYNREQMYMQHRIDYMRNMRP